ATDPSGLEPADPNTAWRDLFREYINKKRPLTKEDWIKNLQLPETLWNKFEGRGLDYIHPDDLEEFVNRPNLQLAEAINEAYLASLRGVVPRRPTTTNLPVVPPSPMPTQAEPLDPEQFGNPTASIEELWGRIASGEMGYVQQLEQGLNQFADEF